MIELRLKDIFQVPYPDVSIHAKGMVLQGERTFQAFRMLPDACIGGEPRRGEMCGIPLRAESEEWGLWPGCRRMASKMPVLLDNSLSSRLPRQQTYDFHDKSKKMTANC